MKRHSFDLAAGLAQVYLLDRDTGLLCRIVGLYAARGLEVLHLDYAYAAQGVMKLSVRVAGDEELMDSVRVLVEKVGTFVGVLAATVDDSRGTATAIAA